MTGSLTTGHARHTATLLPNGKVLVAGGFDSSFSPSSSAEMYDPVSGLWTVASPLTRQRVDQTAALLSNGKVLVAGGFGDGFLSSAELYDPATGNWTVTTAMIDALDGQRATLLPNGQVLFIGGYAGSNGVSKAELYDVGLGFRSSWQPQIATANSPLSLGGSLVLTGSQFRGVSGGSGGNSQDSPTDYPLVQLRSIESGQTTFLLSTNWSTNSFASLPVWNFPPGNALATVFVNGIPSTSSVVNISVPVPTKPNLTSAKTLSNGSFQFAFTNSVGALFGVLATTDLELALTNWTVLGGVIEISPGQFQFTDPQSTNNQRRFYLVRSP